MQLVFTIKKKYHIVGRESFNCTSFQSVIALCGAQINARISVGNNIDYKIENGLVCKKCAKEFIKQDQIQADLQELHDLHEMLY